MFTVKDEYKHLIGAYTPRTADEIIKRIDRIDEQRKDPFAVRISRLVYSLPEKEFHEQYFKYFVRPAHDPQRECPLDEIISYINFAYMKACDCRGISAERSIDHFKELIWLLGNDNVYRHYKVVKNNHFAPYGVPVLNWIIDQYGLVQTRWCMVGKVGYYACGNDTPAGSECAHPDCDVPVCETCAENGKKYCMAH